MLSHLLRVSVAALLLAGCAAEPPPPVVTFAAGSATVTARPTQYCDLKLTDCSADAEARVQLAVPPGTPLRVTVPTEISSAPWHIVFTYEDATAQRIDQRTPLFAPGQRTDYTLELPGPDDRLLEAQVQQFGPPPAVNADTQEIEFPIRASWVLTAAG